MRRSRARLVNGWVAVVASLAAAAAILPAARANGVPPGGVLDFAVERNGAPIGSHVLRFARADAGLEVAIEATILYRIAFIPIYRFVHQAREVWRDGRLLAMTATTDDNGASYDVAVAREDEALVLTVNGDRRRLDPAIVPASLWNLAVTDRGQILDPADGDILVVRARALGTETITVRGQEVAAEHFALEGEFERELWYDPQGVLVQVRFDASDGSEVRYRLR